MTKVVYNACYGGFSLSEAGVRRYLELKGKKVYPEVKNSLITTYWLVPPEERTGILQDNEWHEATVKQRQKSNERYKEISFYDRDIERTDPALVQVVEELGDEASGRCACLKIKDVPEGCRYRIDEYDGNERVMTMDDYEWRTA